MTREQKLMFRLLGLDYIVKDIVTRLPVAFCYDQATADRLAALLNAADKTYVVAAAADERTEDADVG